MTHQSEPDLLVLHALRLKGFAEPADVAEATNIDEGAAGELLDRFRARDLVKRRDGRVSGFLLLPAGKDLHATLLDQDLAAAGCEAEIQRAYAAFLAHNETFKQLCVDWQLRAVDGVQVPNDHSDPAYDAGIAERLAALQPGVAAGIDELAAAMARFAPYAGRLDHAATRFVAGEPTALARPMARSYHDVWMELHEDFLVTLHRDRSEADGF
jgi:DNA-binding MarR family transcriptional regulator